MRARRLSIWLSVAVSMTIISMSGSVAQAERAAISTMPVNDQVVALKAVLPVVVSDQSVS